jgi:hypothetical protein
LPLFVSPEVATPICWNDFSVLPRAASRPQQTSPGRDLSHEFTGGAELASLKFQLNPHCFWKIDAWPYRHDQTLHTLFRDRERLLRLASPDGKWPEESFNLIERFAVKSRIQQSSFMSLSFDGHPAKPEHPLTLTEFVQRLPTLR